MKKLYLAIFISFFSTAQSTTLSFLDSVPEELRDEFVNNNELQEESLEIEDNLQQLDTEELTIAIEEPFFGYSFFETSSETNLPVLDLPLQADYKLSFNDELELLLTGNEQKLIELRIDMSGNVLVPEIGSISLLNLSISEANEKIASIVKNSYIGTESYLSVSKPSLKKISVIGAVKKPGTYLVNPFISLSESLKYAGGLLENSSLRNIKVISLDGINNEYDLYDFLIFGSRKEDSNLKNGDTVLVPATSNFVEISGAVHRPFIYEYLPDDTAIDLVNFSLGFNSKAFKNKIDANFISENGELYSSLLKQNQEIGNEKLVKVFVASKINVSNLDITVEGGSVTDGAFKAVKNETVESFVKRLSFSDDIYPFYFGLRQETSNGLITENYDFSLLDPSTYEDIPIKSNAVFSFYSKNSFVDENDFDIPSNLSKSLKIGDLNLIVPLVGKVTPKTLYEYFGFNKKIDESKVSILTNNEVLFSSYENVVNSDELKVITMPTLSIRQFSVEIIGQVQNPGNYTVDSNTTLNDLYLLAGGFSENAFEKGILLSRESVKERELIALKNAKLILTDAYLASLTNPLKDGMASGLDLESLITLSEDVEVSGRISGDLSSDSEYSLSLILEENDTVLVPNQPTTITITGEILSPNTVGFDSELTYEDYIEMAGGFSRNADKGNIYVIKANGETALINNRIFSTQLYPEAGDTIVVPRNLEKISPVPLVSLATKIIADIAFAAASLNSLDN